MWGVRDEKYLIRIFAAEAYRKCGEKPRIKTFFTLFSIVDNVREYE